MTIKRSYKIFFLLLLVGLVCYYLFSNDEDSKIYKPTLGNTITYILIDGLSSEIFYEELDKGNLPNIQKLVNKSLLVNKGISSCPSMTGYAFYPFLTGRDAVESGVYGLRWFDKTRKKGNLRNYVGRTNIQMNYDIDKKTQTAFERADGQYTCSINTYMNRGVGESIKTGFAHTTAKYDGKIWFTKAKYIPLIGETISKDHYQHETAVTDIAIEQLQKNPKVQWITFPSPDAYNHVNGTDSIYQKLLIHLDHEIGRLVTEIEKLNQKERALAIISDHGISDVKYNIDLCDTLKRYGINMERGKAASVYSSNLVKDISELSELDAFYVINGNLSSYIYLNNSKDKKTWGKKCTTKEIENYQLKNKKTVNFADILSQQKGVELVCYKNDDSSIIVMNQHGKSLITHKNDSFSYKVITGIDPLNYQSDSTINKLTNTGFHSDNTWFYNTMNTTFPDAINRLYDLCIAEKSGDIFITSLKDYDLAADYEVIVDNYKGGHGGIRKEIISVPYILFLPNQKSNVIDAMRSEDLGKIIVEYVFGK